MLCPKCGIECDGDDPKGDGLYMVYICEECGCYFDEDGNIN